VKLAASIPDVDKAIRHNKEFPAKAIIAMDVIMPSRAIDIVYSALGHQYLTVIGLTCQLA